MFFAIKKFNKKAIQWTIFPLILVGLFSCAQNMDKSTGSMEQSVLPFNAISAKLPPPIKARYLDPDSIAPPTIVPLNGKPKVVPAHTNVHPVGTPKITQIPKDLKIITIRKDIPLPIKTPAITRVVPALQQQPMQALTARAGDAAVFNIRHLSDSEGFLGGGQSLLEDSRGHIWIGGSADVFRYDGEKFFRYTKEEGFFDDVYSMMEDSKGNIWFTSLQKGYGYYDGKNVVHFSQLEGGEQNWLQTIQEDSKGNIWLGSNKGLYCYDGKNITFFNKEHIIFKDARTETGYYSDNRINAIFEDSQGHLWWATAGSGVLRYDGQQIIQYTQEEGLIDNYINSILEDSQGQIWFGSGGEATVGKGLSIYTPDRENNKGLGGTFTNYTTQEGLSDNRISGMVEDEEGRIWLATFNGGVTQYDGENFIHFTEAEGLSSNSIHSIIKDRKNNIWLGTNHGILNRIQLNSFRHFTEEQGLSKNEIGIIMKDSRGNIWMDAYFGGIMKYDGKNFTHYTEKEGLLQNVISDILEDSKGNMWFAYRDLGISKFDGKKFTHYTTDQGLSGFFYWDLQEDYQNNIWVACGWKGGMTRINPDNGQITHFMGDEKDGIGGSSLMEDSQHNLWLGGRGLVAIFDDAKEELLFSYNVDPIDNEWVEFLVEDEQKNLWFGTAESFTQVKKNGQDIESDLPRLTLGNGLPNTRINSLLVDNNQNIWLGGLDDGIAVLNKGLEKFGQLDTPWQHYHKEDGLKSRGSYRKACLDNRNRLWWSTPNGITQLDLNTFKIPTQAPQNLSLSYIDLQGQFLDYRNLSDSLYQTTMAFGKTASQSFDSIAAFHNYPKNLKLPYHLNHLTFHFSAVDWAGPHKIQYSYQIEGLEKEWSSPSAEAKADYRNLPYGTHTFKVKAIGEAQIWSEPFEYTFTILPPWWHTWWAYSLYAILAFGVSGWYIQRLRRQINQKQQQLEKEQFLNQELVELNEANSRFVPHDFLQLLGKTSLKELQLGDQTAVKMTILFADIRDYTTLSEKITPEENFKFINAFLGRMGPIIQQNGGFISQYMGDGIMALFKGNHDLAVNAAIEMQQAIQFYNQKRFAQNRQAIRVGIGLNTGQLMLGVIGDKNRYESSVISDAVNTASRMEGLTKVFGCSVIISENTLVELLKAGEKVEDRLKVSPTLNYRFLGKIKVKGKSQIIKIFDCYEGDSEKTQALKTETKADFEAAIHFYFDRKFGKAADLLKIIADKFPEDIATEYYLTKAVKYVIDGVDSDWNGVEEMVNK